MLLLKCVFQKKCKCCLNWSIVWQTSRLCCLVLDFLDDFTKHLHLLKGVFGFMDREGEIGSSHFLWYY
jgi:hypothetical protein